jgi:hypothetical protein
VWLIGDPVTLDGCVGGIRPGDPEPTGSIAFARASHNAPAGPAGGGVRVFGGTRQCEAVAATAALAGDALAWAPMRMP